MTENTNFSSNGTNVKKDSKSTCSICHTTVATADPELIEIVKESEPSEKLFFHMRDLKLNEIQLKEFRKISSGKTLEPLQVSKNFFSNFKGYLTSLANTGEHQKEARIDQSRKIFNHIIRLDRDRSKETTEIVFPSKKQLNESLPDTNGGGFGIAAAVAS